MFNLQRHSSSTNVCDQTVLETPSWEKVGAGRKPDGRKRMQEYITRGIRSSVRCVLWGKQWKIEYKRNYAFSWCLHTTREKDEKEQKINKASILSILSILKPCLSFAPFHPFLVSGAPPRVANIARSYSLATVPLVPHRPMVKLACRCGAPIIWWRDHADGVERGWFLSPTRPLVDGWTIANHG